MKLYDTYERRVVTRGDAQQVFDLEVIRKSLEGVALPIFPLTGAERELLLLAAGELSCIDVGPGTKVSDVFLCNAIRDVADFIDNEPFRQASRTLTKHIEVLLDGHISVDTFLLGNETDPRYPDFMKSDSTGQVTRSRRARWVNGHIYLRMIWVEAILGATL